MPRQHARPGLPERFHRAWLRLGLAAWGALAWAVAMGASASLVAASARWQAAESVAHLAALYALGGALAFPIGLVGARLLAGGGSSERRFAAAVFCLASATVAATACLYALHYRIYYAEWHAPTFSITWGIQFAFTTLAALYQFAVLGLRLFLPLGLAALLAAGFWLARRPR